MPGFSQSSASITIDSNGRLNADCKDASGGVKRSSLDLVRAKWMCVVPYVFSFLPPSLSLSLSLSPSWYYQHSLINTRSFAERTHWHWWRPGRLSRQWVRNPCSSNYMLARSIFITFKIIKVTASFRAIHGLFSADMPSTLGAVPPKVCWQRKRH